MINSGDFKVNTTVKLTDGRTVKLDGPMVLQLEDEYKNWEAGFDLEEAINSILDRRKNESKHPDAKAFDWAKKVGLHNEKEILDEIDFHIKENGVPEKQGELMKEYIKSLKLPDISDKYVEINNIWYPWVYWIRPNMFDEAGIGYLQLVVGPFWLSVEDAWDYFDDADPCGDIDDGSRKEWFGGNDVGVICTFGFSWLADGSGYMDGMKQSLEEFGREEAGEIPMSPRLYTQEEIENG